MHTAQCSHLYSTALAGSAFRPCVYSAAALRWRPALYSALPSSLNRSAAEGATAASAAAAAAAAGGAPLAAAAAPPPAAGASLCAMLLVLKRCELTPSAVPLLARRAAITAVKGGGLVALLRAISAVVEARGALQRSGHCN